MTVLVPAGVDAGAVWHYGDPFAEQKALAAGLAGVDLSHRPVFTISGPDRLTWLHAITSADFEHLQPGVPLNAFILNPQGHITQVFAAIDDGQTLRCHTEPGHAEALLAWLRKMVFAARVEIGDVDDELAVVIAPGAGPQVVSRDGVEAALGQVRAGTWAMEAVRIAAGLPRIFLDTDERTIPNELANPDGVALGPAVHLNKGCYPGQEAVARIFNLGRPPRRLTLLHLDGSADALPAVGAEVLVDGVVVGRMGTSERHYELGPIGLALLKRQTPVDAALVVDGIDAAQELVVNPDVGLHFRATRG
ncbi:MAG: folate-binding protein YgfZ [Actinobacteria bacterium HGW-Actinobacteria-2]|nr:MAG: folate-binding protein YgfZ [Actinobacteria bacterium HGW-Actinobacteria-2]